MPTYEYICENCQFVLSETVSMADFKKRTKCPKCKKIKLIYQYSVHSRVLGQTLGSLAELNTKKMGKYKLEELDRQDIVAGRKPTKEQKAFKDKIRKLNKMTPLQKEKYIYTGET